MPNSLQKDLKKVIKRMRKIQKDIAADDQPVSGGQIEELKNLGARYAEIVGKLNEDSEAGMV